MAKVSPNTLIENEEDQCDQSGQSLSSLPSRCKKKSYLSVSPNEEFSSNLRKHPSNFSQISQLNPHLKRQGSRTSVAKIIGSSQLFISGLIFLILPYIILVKIMRLSLLCTPGHTSDVTPRCGDDWGLRVRHALYLALHMLGCGVYYPICLAVTSDSTGADWKRGMRYLPLVLLCGVSGTFLPVIFTLGVVVVPPITGMIAGPALSRGRYNKGGLILSGFLCTQFVLTAIVAQALGEYMSQEFIFGFQYTILIPFFVQLNQGLAIMTTERISHICQMTEFSRDGFILLEKYQMAFLSILKFCGVLPAFNKSNLYSTLAINIFLDALGRNQVWRIIYRRVKATYRREPVSRRKLQYLSQVALCSELDMDYLPLLWIILINIFNSPIINTLFTILHSSDEYLTLRDDSLLNQSAQNLLILVIFVILGDLATFLMSKLLWKVRLYDIFFVAPYHRWWAIFGGPSVSSPAFSSLLAVAFLLNS